LVLDFKWLNLKQIGIVIILIANKRKAVRVVLKKKCNWNYTAFAIQNVQLILKERKKHF